jgi:hypothetical protein
MKLYEDKLIVRDTEEKNRMVEEINKLKILNNKSKVDI